ncbi:cytidylyltransferase domain-containing protein [Halosolutus amylolyticus]|uniref:Cytidylyltransferase domain-containing protein n=1 Tax=Halosolutus amylolyticus TaxID=2932267 RepID=A0ABD5PNW4_9EURY|nr:acylneuraminate cytidylyltransferase family protein [Halosolutus amylolyticus]
MGEGVLGVIPARGGSKRVPRKNVREIGGIPLVGHAVEQATEAALLEEVVVSTDDEEIAAAARKHGGRVPFPRPERLATDGATSAAVLDHALEWHADRGDEFDAVAMIQPTTPLRRASDIDETIDRWRSTDATAGISVSEYRAPPQWAVTMDETGTLRPYFEEDALWTDDDVPRSQDLSRLLHPNGAVFVADVPAFRAFDGFYTDRTVGYEMPISRSIDVDSPADLELARTLYATHDDPNEE